MEIAFNLVFGLVALFFGADWLVRGSASAAVRLGVTPLMVGLTVVAYGTSTPELLVSVMAAAEGNGAIAIGNVVGSNIFNICAILGLTALVCPLRVQLQLLRVDAPFMIAVALLFGVFFWDRQIALWEAGLFCLAIVGYTALNIRLARRPVSTAVEQEFSEGVPAVTSGWRMDVVLIVGGLVALGVGARFFVEGAVDVARVFRVSEAVIGLTIISAGTSLPELASSLMAAWRRQPDIAIGNVVGSNIYNILGILGVSGLMSSPLEGAGVTRIDTLVMIGASVLLFAAAWTGYRLRRGEGAVFLLIYAGYLWHLWPGS